MSDLPMVIIDQERAIAEAQARRDIVVVMRRRNILQAGVDFGVVPGTSKPTLLKPGAERLCAALGLNPDFELMSKIERWDVDAPLFHYQYKCHLIHIESSRELATGIGSCNSMEAKYRWRKAERVCPVCGKAAIIKGKAEYGGGFVCFNKKGGCGAKFADNDARITSQQDGLVPNDDVFSLINTIDKMAQKRALIAAALIGANASEFFTQDVEDLPGFGGMVIDGEIVENKPAADLPPPSGNQWTNDEATAWAKSVVSDDLPVNQVMTALGIKRWGEWTGDSESASKRLAAWHMMMVRAQ
jgi:hypothetical protein